MHTQPPAAKPAASTSIQSHRPQTPAERFFGRPEALDLLRAHLPLGPRSLATLARALPLQVGAALAAPRTQSGPGAGAATSGPVSWCLIAPWGPESQSALALRGQDYGRALQKAAQRGEVEEFDLTAAQISTIRHRSSVTNCVAVSVLLAYVHVSEPQPHLTTRQREQGDACTRAAAHTLLADYRLPKPGPADATWRRVLTRELASWLVNAFSPGPAVVLLKALRQPNSRFLVDADMQQAIWHILTHAACRGMGLHPTVAHELGATCHHLIQQDWAKHADLRKAVAESIRSGVFFAAPLGVGRMDVDGIQAQAEALGRIFCAAFVSDFSAVVQALESQQVLAPRLMQALCQRLRKIACNSELTAPMRLRTADVLRRALQSNHADLVQAAAFEMRYMATMPEQGVKDLQQSVQRPFPRHVLATHYDSLVHLYLQGFNSAILYEMVMDASQEARLPRSQAALAALEEMVQRRPLCRAAIAALLQGALSNPRRTARNARQALFPLLVRAHYDAALRQLEKLLVRPDVAAEEAESHLRALDQVPIGSVVPSFTQEVLRLACNQPIDAEKHAMLLSHLSRLSQAS